MAEVTLKEIYPVPEKFRKKAYIKSREEYEKMWKESVEDPENILGEKSPKSTSLGSRNGTRSWTATTGKA